MNKKKCYLLQTVLKIHRVSGACTMRPTEQQLLELNEMKFTTGDGQFSQSELV